MFGFGRAREDETSFLLRDVLRRLQGLLIRAENGRPTAGQAGGAPLLDLAAQVLSNISTTRASNGPANLNPPASGQASE